MLRRAVLVPLLAPLVALLLGAAACSDDGRTLAPPDPDQTLPTTAPTVTGDAGVQAFVLTSEAFADGDPLPERFTCYGAGTSPPLAWQNIPAAVELALVVRDRDADGRVHWIVTGIDPVVTGFGEGGVPEGAAEQANAAGVIGWEPACPPAGDERHVYDFVLHGLQAPLEVDPALPAADVAAQIEGASVGSARLTASAAPPGGD